MLKAAPSELKVGDFVEWGQSQNNAVAKGKIVDIRKDGEAESSISGYTLTGTEDDPVYVMKLLQRDSQGNEVITDQTVVHRASALRKIPDPIKSVKTMFGGEIKAKGKGIVEGYLVRFGNSSDTDLERDYFTKNTDFGIDFTDGSTHKLGLYYNHGMDSTLGTNKIGYGTIKMTDKGLWYSAQINMADEYAKMIYDLAQNGKLGFSSGAASHMVERERSGKSFEIKRWALAEASLTPQPAESRNMAEAKNISIKEYEMEDQHEEIEHMVEGLVAINATPEDIAKTVFDGVHEDMLYKSFKCLCYKLIDGLVAVKEYGKREDADALLNKFHMIALEVFDSSLMMPEMMMEEKMMMEEMMKEPMMDMKSASSIKDVEKILRDAGNLSRSQAKTLANLVWNSQRDVENNQEPEVKTTEIQDSNADLRRALLEKAKKYGS